MGSIIDAAYAAWDEEESKSTKTITTIKDVLQNAVFGDKFLTTTGKIALFLRRARNSEYEFMFFYVQGWGTIQVFANTGNEVNGDAEHSIVGRYPTA